jgi:hypothetical protein
MLTQTERRLRRGALVLKTSDEAAEHGAFWTWLDTGHLADGRVCAKLERCGLLVAPDGLFGGTQGQTYRLLKPPAKERKAWTGGAAKARRKPTPKRQSQPVAGP